MVFWALRFCLCVCGCFVLRRVWVLCCDLVSWLVGVLGNFVVSVAVSGVFVWYVGAGG